MVKKWIIMIVLMILLVVGCIVESIYVNKSFDNLIDSLNSLQIELDLNKDNINTKLLFEKAENIHEDWHKKVKVLKCLIWHTGIKDVEIGLARISVYIEENDYTEASAEVLSLVDFRISWENIF